MGIALAGVALGAMAYGVVDPLSDDIATTLRQVLANEWTEKTGMNLPTHHPARGTDGSRFIGAAVVLLGVLVGGIPLALIALALAGRTRQVSIRWGSRWAAVFKTGFVVQVSSVIVTGLVALMMIVVGEGSLVAGAFFLVNGACGAFGVRAWRALQTAVTHEPPMRIAE